MLLLGHQPRIALEYLTAALQMKTFMNLCLSSGTPVLRWMLMMSGTDSFCILCYWITRNINQYWNLTIMLRHKCSVYDLLCKPALAKWGVQVKKNGIMLASSARGSTLMRTTLNVGLTMSDCLMSLKYFCRLSPFRCYWWCQYGMSLLWCSWLWQYSGVHTGPFLYWTPSS